MVGDLAARNVRLITMAHMATALTLSLMERKWGMVLRAELLLQVALAGRNSDCRQPLYKHLAVRCYAHLAAGALDVANDAIGPHPAVAVIWNCAVSKSAKGGGIENRSAVRYLHPVFCPVGATADYVMWDLCQPGRLCKENLLHCHLLRSPSSTSRQLMGDTELGKPIKKLLMDLGVKCDRTILPEGKHETMQGLKKLDFTDQQLAMGHNRSTTEQSYRFTTALRTKVGMAGHGERLRTEHHLGRATVQPPSALLSLALPGLDELTPRLAEVRRRGPTVPARRVPPGCRPQGEEGGPGVRNIFPAANCHHGRRCLAGVCSGRGGPPPGKPQGARGRTCLHAARDTSAVAVVQERLRQEGERRRQAKEPMHSWRAAMRNCWWKTLVWAGSGRGVERTRTRRPSPLPSASELLTLCCSP